ncbi:MAG: hypothetical protein ACRCWF_04730 [Beijerinckiaceae bacterium]
MLSHEHLAHLVGFFAAGATICAFYCRDMLRLRVAALAANVLFVVYSILLMLIPVLVLHLILLPLNICRLRSFLKQRKPAPT